MTQLRPYQLCAVGGVLRHWATGSPRVILELPTGAGKTHTASDITRRRWLCHDRIAVVAHRRELVDQLRSSLERVGIYAGDPWSGAQARVGTVQQRWPDDDPVDLLVTDEAHRRPAPSYCALAEKLRPTLELQLTATPVRSDRKGMAADACVDSGSVGASIRDLQRLGVLRRERYILPDRDPSTALEGARTGTEYALGAVDDILRTNVLCGDLVEAWQRWCADRVAISFAANVDDAQAITAALQRAGARAACVHHRMHKRERAEILEQLRAGELDVATNVGILTEGFDAPSVSAVLWGCATTSPIKWRQGNGRALRMTDDHDTAVIVDAGGNMLRHGWASDPMPAAKLGTSPRKPGFAPPMTRCRSCSAWISCAPQRPERCRYCDAEIPRAFPGGRTSIEWQAGEWVEVTTPPPEFLGRKDRALLSRLQRQAREAGYHRRWAFMQHDHIMRQAWREELEAWQLEQRGADADPDLRARHRTTQRPQRAARQLR